MLISTLKYTEIELYIFRCPPLDTKNILYIWKCMVGFPWYMRENWGVTPNMYENRSGLPAQKSKKHVTFSHIPAQINEKPRVFNICISNKL